MFLSPQSDLSDGIAMLVAGNDRIQAIITQMEEICKSVEVSVTEIIQTDNMTL